MKYVLAMMLSLVFPVVLHAQASTGSVTSAGNIITVKGYGGEFDGAYDVVKLAKDSCVTGDCVSGEGRKILASVSEYGPHIRIMQGTFKHGTFVGSGSMLIEGEVPVFDGTYEIEKCKPNYKHNTVGAKAVFHPKGSTEEIAGFFSGYLDYNIGKAMPEYQKFVVCRFSPSDAEGDKRSKWASEKYYPWYSAWSKALMASPEFKAAQARAAAEIHAKYGDQSGAKDKCSCCNGKGTIVSESFNHAMGSGVNYKKYENVRCNCCHGTGRAADQTEFKANTDGGAKLDYKH